MLLGEAGEEAQFASAIGYECIEVMCWPNDNPLGKFGEKS
jgi:hypothetical protein